MKKLTSYIIITFFAVTTLALASPDNDAAMTREKSAWQAYKDRKTDEFKKMLATNYQGLYADGVVDATKEVADMAKMSIKSFSLSDFKATSTDADTMVVTYKVTLDATVDGQASPGAMNAASVWQKHGSDWQVVFHSNVAAETSATATSSPTK